jgi:hypothetical protein
VFEARALMLANKGTRQCVDSFGDFWEKFLYMVGLSNKFMELRKSTLKTTIIAPFSVTVILGIRGYIIFQPQAQNDQQSNVD